MPFLHGVISDKLRALLTTDEILNNPHPNRSDSPTAKPVPKKAKGTRLSKPDRKKK